MKINALQMVIIVLLTGLLIMKSCEREVKPVGGYISRSLDSLEIENSKLKSKINIDNTIIAKLKKDKIKNKDRLAKMKETIKNIKVNFEAALEVIDVLSLDSNVVYLNNSLNSLDAIKTSDSTVTISDSNLREINKAFVAVKYLTTLKDSLETEIWVSNTQHIVDDQIIKLQESNIQGLELIIVNKDLALKDVKRVLASESLENKKLRRKSRIRGFIAITSTAIAATSIAVISYLVK